MPAPRPAGLTLRATLLPVSAGQPFAGAAVVGPAVIREEDRREWEEAQREGHAGAGPDRPEALGTVRGWLPAPVTPSASGGARLGPVEVPPAPRYHLLAWGPDGTFYEADFYPETAPTSGELDAGALAPTAPTGVRVRLARGLPGEARIAVRLERIVSRDAREAERATRVLPVLTRARPEVAAALQEGGLLPLSPEGETLLAPLPPDPAVRLRLFSATGVEGAPVEVPLREGRLEVVELDWQRLLPEAAHGTRTLQGRVLLEGATRPPPGAVLVRDTPQGEERLALAEDGRFRVTGLPATRPSRFEVTVPQPGSGRPLAPPRAEFVYTPDPGGEAAEVTWRVPRYRWLVLRLDGHARAQLALDTRPPYPVFVLQRADAAGTWRTQGAEAFVQEREGMAVSLRMPGRYRVLAAASPSFVLRSEAVEVGPGDGEREVRLEPPSAVGTCEVQVVWRASGRPVPGARVTLGGAVGALPPVRGRTDGEGRYRLGRVHADTLHVEVEAAGAEPVEREALAPCAAEGVVRVEL